MEYVTRLIAINNDTNTRDVLRLDMLRHARGNKERYGEPNARLEALRAVDPHDRSHVDALIEARNARDIERSRW
ncbi:MAG: hypothetical protein C0436_03380 [Alphaproteobacteria bacterium]|nr:hypothetical protein [Alphaproteobacteria bacterium]